MRITIPGWRSPVCKNGHQMEIYLDVYSEKLKVKCIYCGYEKSVFIPFDFDSLTLRAVVDIARSLIE